MRLDFNVLWVDDQPKNLHGSIERLADRLLDLGLKLKPRVLSNLDQVREFLGDNVFDDRIDLILVDYDLGNGKGGEQVLEAIRQTFPFRDTVLYSATSRDDLRKAAYDKRVDGIYFLHRDRFVDGLIKLVENILQWVMDIDHMRGVVIAATSDIDDFVESSLVHLLYRLEDERRAEYFEALATALVKQVSGYAKQIEKAASRATLEAFLKLHFVYSSRAKLEHLIEQLRTTGLFDSDTILEMTKYRDEVQPTRNSLAHIKVGDDGQTLRLRGSDDVLTVESMTQLRRQLIRHRELFENIAEKLKPF